jgi:pyrroline-5-carboxylate reductase
MTVESETLKDIGFVGGGNMGFALAKAISGRFPEATIHVCDLRRERVELFQRELPRVQAASDPPAVAEAAEVFFVAVKPQDIRTVLEAIRDTEKLLISIAAGVAINRIEGVCPRARVVRVMPNTPCLVGAMAAGYAFGSRIRPGDGQLVKQLLGAAGYAAEVEESLLDGVTGLSGSGPAFVARLIEAFIAAGEEIGLEPEVARKLSLQTFYGTAKLLAETGMEPGKLVEMVSSPKGTTVAGREILEASDYSEVIGTTIRAAAERSKELGR